MAKFVEDISAPTPQGTIKSPVVDNSAEVLAKGLTQTAQDYLKTSSGSGSTKADAYDDVLGQATAEYAELNDLVASGNIDRKEAAYRAEEKFYHYSQYVPQKSEFFANMRDSIVSGKTKDVIYADAIAMEKGRSDAVQGLEKQKYETAYQLGVEGVPTYRSPDGSIDADRTLRTTLRQQQQFTDTKRQLDIYQNDTTLQKEVIKSSYYNPAVADAFEKEFSWALSATPGQIQNSQDIAAGKKPYLIAINNVSQARKQGRDASPQDLAMVNNYALYSTQQLNSQFVQNGIRPDILPANEGGIHPFIKSTMDAYIGQVSPEGTVKMAQWQDQLQTLTDKADVRKVAPGMTKLANVYGDNFVTSLLTEAGNKEISSYLSERDKVFSLFNVAPSTQGDSGLKVVPTDANISTVEQAGTTILSPEAPKADIDRVGSGGLLVVRKARETNDFLANGKVAGSFLNASANLANAASVGSNIPGQGVDQLIKEFNDPVTQAQINDSANMAPEQFKQFGQTYGTKLEQEIAARKLMVENSIQKAGFADQVDIVFTKNTRGGFEYSLNIADSAQPGKGDNPFQLSTETINNLKVMNTAALEHQKLSSKGAIDSLDTKETVAVKAKGNLNVYDPYSQDPSKPVSKKVKGSLPAAAPADQKRLNDYTAKKTDAIDAATTDAYMITANNYIKEPMGGKGVGELKQEFIKRWKANPKQEPSDVFVKMQIDLTGDEAYLPLPPKPEMAGQPISTPQPSADALKKLTTGN